MSTFSCTLVVDLFEPSRALPDRPGLKGYNVYQATFPLHGSEIPINIAHKTLLPRHPNGTRARVTGNSNFLHTALLIVATRLIVAPVLPLLGSELSLTLSLPRFVLAGVVSSQYEVQCAETDSITFDVTISRKFVFPLQDLVLKAYTNRDWKRLTLNEYPAINTPVFLSGVFSGWSKDNSPLVDVHTLSFNYSGKLPPARIIESPNPFERAAWVNGFAVFALWLRAAPASYGYNLISCNAPPTRIQRQVTAPPPDPRLTRGPAARPSPSVTPDGPPAAADKPMDVDVVESLQGAPPAATVTKAGLAARISGWMPGDSLPRPVIPPFSLRTPIPSSTVPLVPIPVAPSTVPTPAGSASVNGADSRSWYVTFSPEVPSSEDAAASALLGLRDVGPASAAACTADSGDTTAVLDSSSAGPSRAVDGAGGAPHEREFVSVQDVRDAFEQSRAQKRAHAAGESPPGKIRKVILHVRPPAPETQ
ncbi:hypothetical protein AURDEDRAFT_127456 [Auricularia subglabra TFB-10046 SS5]|nr:hypothetical protein AURDEDRAFT_127456 [Auricularia subglabra TFB-10046 SS5]